MRLDFGTRLVEQVEMSFFNKLKNKGIAKRERKKNVQNHYYRRYKLFTQSVYVVIHSSILFSLNKNFIQSLYIGGSPFLTRIREEVKADICLKGNQTVFYNEIILYKRKILFIYSTGRLGEGSWT